MVDMLASAPTRLPRASLKWLGSAIVAALTQRNPALTVQRMREHFQNGLEAAI